HRTRMTRGRVARSGRPVLERCQSVSGVARDAMPFDSIFRPDLFAGETHIVTGGGSGIGRCTAHELGRLGATVVVVGRKAERIQAVRAELERERVTAHAVPCVSREETQCAAMVRPVLERTGRIDGLVNNAGGQFAAPLASINQKGWETV